MMTAYEIWGRVCGEWELIPRRAGVDPTDSKAADRDAQAALATWTYEATRVIATQLPVPRQRRTWEQVLASAAYGRR